MDLVNVGTDKLSEFWPEVRGLLHSALEYSGGRFSEKSILDCILTGEMQLWVVMDGIDIISVFVTNIMNYRTGLRVCDIILLSGNNMVKWLPDCTDRISEWASQIGCTKIQMMGRPGWEKALKNWGKISVAMERSVGEYHG